jgi:hypothetical protein
MKLSARPKAQNHHILLFGPPKCGKTKLAGDLSSDFDLLWFDLESGVDTLKQLPIEQQERVEVISIPDTRSYPIAIETLLKVVKGGKVEICEAHGRVACPICKKSGDPVITVELNALPENTIVVFDSLTQLTNSAISNITRDKPDDYKLDYDDWGNLGKLMDMFLSHIQNAPYKSVCISHEIEVEMVDGKSKIVPTAGTRNFSRNSAKYFSEVVYMEVKNGKHRAGSSTSYANNILTGSRSGAVLEKAEKPSLVPIFKGEVVPVTAADKPNAPDSPGNKAVAGLANIQARLKAGVK